MGIFIPLAWTQLVKADLIDYTTLANFMQGTLTPIASYLVYRFNFKAPLA